MSTISLRAAVGAAAVGTMLVMGSGIAQAEPAVSTDPAPVAVVQPQVQTQQAALSLPLVPFLGPLAPFVAGVICIPSTVATPLAYLACVV